MRSNPDNTNAARVSPCDAIRRKTDDGSDYWSAREIARVLGYERSYRNFLPVIAKAEVACKQSGYIVPDHFARVRTMVMLGSGAKREVDANKAHYTVGAIVRRVIIEDLGGTPPESCLRPRRAFSSLKHTNGND